MKRDLGTSDDRAFALAHEGSILLDRYAEEHDVGLLRQAETHLRAAAERDPSFAFALFTHGAALESLGDVQAAIDRFDHLRNRFPDYNPDLVTYNLATAHLCLYRSSAYDQAEPLFIELTQESTRQDVRMLAFAGLATVYALRMVKIAGRPDREADIRSFQAKIEDYADRAGRIVQERPQRDWYADEAQWQIHNARGIKHMYLALHDFKCDRPRIASETQFDLAQREFESSLRVSPRNLDALSNLGTLHLFRWKVAPADRDDLLEESRKMWLIVVRARPEMSFGHFRLGQVERRRGDFVTARDALNRSLSVFQEVEEAEVRKELALAEASDSSDSDRRAG